MRVVTACLTPCCSVEITADQIHGLIFHSGTNCKVELLPNITFLGIVVVDVQRHDSEGLLAIKYAVDDEKWLLRRYVASHFQILS